LIDLVLNGIALAFSLAMLALASRFAIKSIENLIELTHLSEASFGFAIISVMTGIHEISVGVGGKFILFAAILNVILR